jgi:hypothetical protein
MNNYHNPILQGQVDAYRPNFIQHGDTPQGTYQNNVVTIEERYRQLIASLLPFLPHNFTLCDLGSGTCDLHGYLLNNGIKHQYTGIEIVPEMRDVSIRKFPDIEILDCDILDEHFTTTFDAVVASGTFNLRGNVTNDLWQEYVLGSILKMFRLSRVGMAYNAITAYSDFRVDSLYYMSPHIAIDHAQRSMSRFYTLTSTYPLFEFTMTVLNPSYVSSTYVASEFDKYFPERTSKIRSG